MAISKVRARTQSIKLLDVVNLETLTQEQAQSLDEQGFCLWMRCDGSGLVIPSGAYDALCELVAEAVQ